MNKDLIHKIQDIEHAVEKAAHSAAHIISDAAHNIAEATHVIASATQSTFEKLQSTQYQLKSLLEKKGVMCASEEIIKGRELPTIIAKVGGEHISEGHDPSISKHLFNRVMFGRDAGEEDLSNAMNLKLEIKEMKFVAIPGAKLFGVTTVELLQPQQNATENE